MLDFIKIKKYKKTSQVNRKAKREEVSEKRTNILDLMKKSKIEKKKFQLHL